MIGPEDFSMPEDYSNSKSGSSPFSYNPAANDIVPQTGAFPEPTDVELPEKI